MPCTILAEMSTVCHHLPPPFLPAEMCIRDRPTDGGMAKEEFIRVGTTLYKIVEQPRLNGGYVRKRIAWNLSLIHI